MVFVTVAAAVPAGAVCAAPLAAAKAALTALASSGPGGWIILGKSECSWTCWKKVIHDESDSSDGVPLSYIFQHDKVKAVSTYDDHYIVENIWKETFKIYYVTLPNGEIAAHAE